MAIVDNDFREWIADFKAANPGVANSRAILDTAQYAFAAGRKAQRLASRAEPKKRLAVLLLSEEELEALIMHAPVIMAMLDSHFDGESSEGVTRYRVEYHIHASVCAALDQLEKEGKL